jgi:hypothetical protein
MIMDSNPEGNGSRKPVTRNNTEEGKIATVLTTQK